MKLARKVRLYPTAEQEKKMYQHYGGMKFVYNWGLGKNIEYYKTTGKTKSAAKLGTELTQLKKQAECSWLNDVSAATLKEALRDLQNAYTKFFEIQKKTKGFSKSKIKKATMYNRQLTNYDLMGHPKFKTKKKNEVKFYTRYDKLAFADGLATLEVIGKVKYESNLPIPEGKYSNPRVKFDGKYWILSFAIEVGCERKEELADMSIGIDVGVKDLAICSNGEVFKNINKTHEVKRLEFKLRRMQRQVSRKYEMNKKDNKFVKTNNIRKLEKKIKQVHSRLANIRLNHIHQATNSIVKTKPYRVVMEDLNVSGMMKNKHLSKAIQQQCLSEFARQMKYKCKKYGIEYIEADRWYPSSKTCSCCGNIKKDLKLKDRVYECDNCGMVLDRDWNASINLVMYDVNWVNIA